MGFVQNAMFSNNKIPKAQRICKKIHEKAVSKIHIRFVECFSYCRVVVEAPHYERRGLPQVIAIGATRRIKLPNLPVCSSCVNVIRSVQVDRHWPRIVKYNEISLVSIEHSHQKRRKSGCPYAASTGACNCDLAGIWECGLSYVHTRRLITQTAVKADYGSRHSNRRPKGWVEYVVVTRKD